MCCNFWKDFRSYKNCGEPLDNVADVIVCISKLIILSLKENEFKTAAICFDALWAETNSEKLHGK